MPLVSIVKWFKQNTINCELQRFRVAFYGLADILQVEGYFAPLGKWLGFLGRQQNRPIKRLAIFCWSITGSK
jgi:hypothetical protein